MNETEQLKDSLLKATLRRLKTIADNDARKGNLARAATLRAIIAGTKGGFDILIEVLGPETPQDILSDLSGEAPADVALVIAQMTKDKAKHEQEAQARLVALSAQEEERALERVRPVSLVLGENESLPIAEIVPYTTEQLTTGIAQQSKLSGSHHSLETFRPLIGIRRPTGDTIYAYSFWSGDYFQTTKDGFQKWIWAESRLWPQVFFDRFIEGADGARLKTSAEIVEECTTMAECPENEGGPIRGQTDLQTGYFDYQKKQFVLAQCPLRRLPPAKCEAFADFLTIALPDDPERIRFEDHMLAQLDLSRVSAGVHIAGLKATAKSAVVEGIARLYGVKGSTPGALFHTKHNDWTNPIVHEEEKPAKDEDGEPITAAHRREVITRRNHVLNPKNVRQYVVNGYTRNWFTENGDKMFNFSGETEAELHATAERIDSFTFDGEVAAWIAERGGPDFVKPWIEQDLIARHVLWLSTQRGIVNKGARMLVEGRLSKSVAMLQAQDRSVGRVLNCIARYVAYDSHKASGPFSGMKGSENHRHRAVIWGDGKIGVNANRLLENWTDVMPNERVPPTLEIVRSVIDRCADGKKSDVVKVGGKACRMRYLKVESFMEYVEQYDIEDPDELKAKIGLVGALVEKEPEGKPATVTSILTGKKTAG